MSAEDAAAARDMGCDGVIVSNHGGRQLDSALHPLAALKAIKAEAGDMTVMIDSGFNLYQGAACDSVGDKVEFLFSAQRER